MATTRRHKAWLAGTLLLASMATKTAAQAENTFTCYDTWGTKDANQLPCFASGTTLDSTKTTHCCNKNDYCLSNGLCLSPGSNNLMTQQGCTNKEWDGCQQFCDSKRELPNSANSIPLVPCPASLNGNDVKFCCGPDASSCCSPPPSSSLPSSSTPVAAVAQLSIPTGTIIRPYATLLTYTSVPTSQILPGQSPPATKSSSDADFALKIGLGIGLGIGLPILIVLTAVAYLLARNPPRGGGHGKHGHSPSRALDHHHLRTFTPSRSGRDREKRDSFGRVDTNVGPPSDDGQIYTMAAWPPNGTNVAAAIAAWATAANNNNNEPPPSPKEMDARSRAGSRLRNYFLRGETPTKFGPAELPGETSGDLERGQHPHRAGPGPGTVTSQTQIRGREVEELPTTASERDDEDGLSQGNQGSTLEGALGREIVLQVSPLTAGVDTPSGEGPAAVGKDPRYGFSSRV